MSTHASPGPRLGRYEIKTRLGKGGMGEVYLAEDVSLNRRKVALKLLPAEVTENRERLTRFEQEASAASALNHPNILTIYEFGQTEGTQFIATEYVDGVTLRQYLTERRLKLHDVLEISTQIAAALVAAHEAHIVHRDIKPENVMVRRDRVVKVLDFGLAKLSGSALSAEAVDSEAGTRMLAQTAPGLLLGTVAYMSPEQSRGDAVDARADIWALGVVLYEMIAGRLPFEGRDVHRQIIAIQESEPPPLAQAVAGVPERLEEIVNKALAKEPDERYQTAKDLLIDLRRLKQKLEVDAEIDRTIAPAARSTTSTGAGPHTAQTGAPTTRQPAAQTAVQPPVHATSSVEYLVGQIKQHRRTFMLVTLAALFMIAGLSYWLYTRTAPRTVAIESIAVLPFVNASNDPNMEYLSDGISEALINSLTELQQLRVVARATAFRYKGKDIDPQTVGRELNVRAVLLGRVRQLGDTLDVQADLVDAQTGAQLWGAEYERKAADVLAVKQAITREIADRLKLRLSGEEQRQLVKHDTTNPEAYQFYLKGRYYWNKRTADGIKKAIEQFQQAIDRDPGYALGYVGLADCYAVLEEYAGTPASETVPKAKAAADRALQLDDSLAEAHSSSGEIYNNLWRWAEADEEFKRAISLNPNYATAHQWYSHYFRDKRQFDDAWREIKRAQELDPLSSIISNNVAALYLLKNDLGAALEQCNRIIELDPGFPHAYDFLGWTYLKQHRNEEATKSFEKAVELSGRASEYLGDLGYCYAVTGQRAKALAILKELEEKYARRESNGQYIASVYAGFGDKDQTFAWLEKDFAQHSGQLSRINWRFNFDDLRTDPRYQDLTRRMGLTP